MQIVLHSCDCHCYFSTCLHGIFKVEFLNNFWFGLWTLISADFKSNTCSPLPYISSSQNTFFLSAEKFERGRVIFYYGSPISSMMYELWFCCLPPFGFVFPISFIQPELSPNLSLTVDSPHSLQAYTNCKFHIEPGDENREGTYGICLCISW